MVQLELATNAMTETSRYIGRFDQLFNELEEIIEQIIDGAFNMQKNAVEKQNRLQIGRSIK